MSTFAYLENRDRDFLTLGRMLTIRPAAALLCYRSPIYRYAAFLKDSIKKHAPIWYFNKSLGHTSSVLRVSALHGAGEIPPPFYCEFVRPRWYLACLPYSLSTGFPIP